MGLTSEEKKMLRKLQQKAEAPDPPEIGKTLNVSVDLSNPKSVAAAIKYGFLSGPDDDGSDDTDDEEMEDGSDDDDDTPVRNGYFGK